MKTTTLTENRFNYLLGLINIVAVFCIVWLLWYIFMHPDGILRLYTPMYGFALVVVFLSAIMLIKDIFNYYPFAETLSRNQSPLTRGILLTVTAILILLFIFYVLFWGFIGKFGITYFSPYSIIAAGSQGAEIWNAREISSRAILYLSPIFHHLFHPVQEDKPLLCAKARNTMLVYLPISG